eukprot:12882036-Prorocentrum_lima.AAC.1
MGEGKGNRREMRESRQQCEKKGCEKEQAVLGLGQVLGDTFEPVPENKSWENVRSGMESHSSWCCAA